MKRRLWNFTPARFSGVAAALAACAVAIAPASAITIISDDFSVPHNYSDGAAHGIWTGVHNIEQLGAGTLATAGGNLNAANAGVNYGWEGGRSNAPFLYTRIPAAQANNPGGPFDYRATVKLNSQTFGNWSAAGIIARTVVPGGDPPSGTTGGTHADEYFVTAVSFYTNDENGTPGVPEDDIGNAQRQQKMVGAGVTAGAGDSGGDIVGAWVGAGPGGFEGLDEQNPFPIWLRLTRIDDPADPLRKRHLFEASTDGVNFHLQSAAFTANTAAAHALALNNGNLALDIGLSFHTFGTLDGSAVFGGGTFVLEYIPEPTSVSLALFACCALASCATRRRRK
jgi:hypothetical protein